MQSRMNKYYDNNDDDNLLVNNGSSRVKRNQDLYKEVSNLEIEDFDLNSNASVIGDNKKNIYLDDIKGILEERYPERKKKHSFGDSIDVSLDKLNLDETREYDINAILEKVKEQREVNYEIDRHKKLRTSQADILKEIEAFNKAREKKRLEKDLEKDLEKELEEEIDTKSTKKNLKDLTRTIVNVDNEEDTSSGELDPLDILTELRGTDENTKVLGALSDVYDESLEDDKRDEEKDNLDEEIDKVLEQTIIDMKDFSNDDWDTTILDLDTDKIDTTQIDTSKIILSHQESEIEEEKHEDNDLNRKFVDFVYERPDKKVDENTIDIRRNIKEEIKNNEVSYFKTEELGNIVPAKDIEKTMTKTEELEDMMATKTLEIEKSNTAGIDKSFVGKTMSFTQSDFDDFNDLKEDMHTTKIIMKILIFVIIIGFIVGCIIFLNEFLNLGLF